MILLDTNVISEFTRAEADVRVIEWLNRQPAASIWTTSVNVFELRLGLHRMPPGRRHAELAMRVERWLNEVVQDRIKVFDREAAQCAALLAAERLSMGRPGELRDTMIAGIVLANHATLATRNVRHFEEIAGSVVNPWEH